MENASKALLIAGAVLIVIVLISVGMLILNSTNDVTTQAGDTSTSQAIQTFNSSFVQYEGSQKGSTVKNLKQTVKASNAANPDHQIAGNILGDTSAVVNSKKYKITIDYGSDGYVNIINFE